MDFWYTFGKVILRTYVTLFMRSVEIQGLENLLPGPKIIAANHPNVTDGLILPFIIKEKIHFLMHGEAFKLPILGRLFALADQIPVYRDRGSEAHKTALNRLASGHAIAIFPVGRLSPDKGFRCTGTGAAILALESGAPIIQVGFFVPRLHTKSIKADFFDRGAEGRFQVGGSCFIQIGAPWIPAMAAKADQSYRTLRDLSDKLMARISTLTQQAQSWAECIDISG